MTHQQIDLPELGFTVDQGLEDLIRACWRRGIATAASCIGGIYRDDAEILFDSLAAGWRWEDVTARDCDWNEDNLWTPAAAFFPASDIPALVETLGAVDPWPIEMKAYRAALLQDRPFTREVRRQRLERELAGDRGGLL